MKNAQEAEDHRKHACPGLVGHQTPSGDESRHGNTGDEQSDASPEWTRKQVRGKRHRHHQEWESHMAETDEGEAGKQPEHGVNHPEGAQRAEVARNSRRLGESRARAGCAGLICGCLRRRRGLGGRAGTWRRDNPLPALAAENLTWHYLNATMRTVHGTSFFQIRIRQTAPKSSAFVGATACGIQEEAGFPFSRELQGKGEDTTTNEMKRTPRPVRAGLRSTKRKPAECLCSQFKSCAAGSPVAHTDLYFKPSWNGILVPSFRVIRKT